MLLGSFQSKVSFLFKVNTSFYKYNAVCEIVGLVELCVFGLNLINKRALE